MNKVGDNSAAIGVDPTEVGDDSVRCVADSVMSDFDEGSINTGIDDCWDTSVGLRG